VSFYKAIVKEENKSVFIFCSARKHNRAKKNSN
jgi:hypothetical protein